jgi:3',5'-cyclic AMP phosphodiesterase CpdA
MKRSSFLKRLAIGASGIPLIGAASKASLSSDSFSFVHLTDSHVQRRRSGHLGFANCVTSVNALDPKPDLVLMGGDMVFDGLYTDKDVYLDQIALFKEGAAKLDMPWYPCMGNHDVFGLSARRKTTVDDPDIGKKVILDALDWKSPYYSFNHKNWHFVVLDTIFQVETENGPSYVPRIGDEQLEWLRFDLGAHNGMPTVVLMHIAAFCHSPQLTGNPEAKAYSGLVISDNNPLREILERHKVKVVLQGHTHQNEDFRWNDVWYVTSQSVSAAWWGGNWRGFKPGYTVYTAHADGNITWERREYEWEHQLEPEDTLERDRIQQREDFIEAQRELYLKEIGAR